jgi:hypothetical protein
MNWIKKTFREPLFHFLLIGAALFLVYHYTNRTAGDQLNRIIVTPAQVEQLKARFSRTWVRPPTQEEQAGLIESHVRDEVYYREAVAMGLDQNDPTIRQRMRMKLEFLLEDLSVVGEISDAALREFLQLHPDKFRLEPRVSVRQIYLDPDKHQDVEAGARDLLGSLTQGAEPEEAGDSTMLPYEILQASQSVIARSFGEDFAQQVVALAPGGWVGPVYSRFGAHLVMIDDRRDARLPQLSEVRDQVEREYLALRRQEMKDGTYQRLRAGYEVVIESPVAAEGQPVGPIAGTRSGENTQ